MNCTAIPKVLLSSIGFYIINTSLLILKIPELCLQLIAESRVSKKVDFSSCTIFPSVGKVKLFPFLSPLGFKPFGTGVFTIHHHWLVTSEVICWIWRFSSKGGGVDFVRWKVWARKSGCKFVMLTNHVTISTDILFHDSWCLLHEIYISPIILILPNKYLTWTRTCWPWSNRELSARRSWVGLLWSPWTACMAQQTSNGPVWKKKLQHPFHKGGEVEADENYCKMWALEGGMT